MATSQEAQAPETEHWKTRNRREEIGLGGDELLVLKMLGL